MTTDTVKDKIERWKLLAEELISKNQKCYIKDLNDEYYFGDIILSGEDTIEVECFSPENKAGKRFILRWIQVIKFDEYKERSEEDV